MQSTPSVVFNLGQFFSLSLLVITTEVCYLYLVGRSQGCSCTSYNVQGQPQRKQLSNTNVNSAAVEKPWSMALIQCDTLVILMTNRGLRDEIHYEMIHLGNKSSSNLKSINRCIYKTFRYGRSSLHNAM